MHLVQGIAPVEFLEKEKRGKQRLRIVFVFLC